jgi:hypothetical protein
MEGSSMVKVLVGQFTGQDEFSGFWAEFEGEKISSYEDNNGFVYTLYKSTAYRSRDAYRVHRVDETNPLSPIYELLPYIEDTRIPPNPTDYTEPYTKEQVANTYPLFVKDLDYLETHRIDPAREVW